MKITIPIEIEITEYPENNNCFGYVEYKNLALGFEDKESASREVEVNGILDRAIIELAQETENSLSTEWFAMQIRRQYDAARGA